jgi:hypothetical protein
MALKVEQKKQNSMEEIVATRENFPNIGTDKKLVMRGRLCCLTDSYGRIQKFGFKR